MKKENIFNLFLMIVIGVLVVVSTVQAATTISTNIVTEGTLSVTGTTTLMGNVGVGTDEPAHKLHVIGNIFSNNGEDGVILGEGIVGSNSGLFSANADQEIATFNALTNNYRYGDGAIEVEFFPSTFRKNLGVGVTVDPDVTLSINRNFQIFGHEDQTESYLDITSFEGIKGDILKLTNLGNVGIGTTTPTEKLVVEGNLKVTGTTNGVKVYRAFLTFNDTNHPTVVVLENSIGSIAVTRTGVGVMAFTLTGAFTNNKTFLMVNGDDSTKLVLFRNSANVVNLQTKNPSTFANYDTSYNGAHVEILVYP